VGRQSVSVSWQCQTYRWIVVPPSSGLKLSKKDCLVQKSLPHDATPRKTRTSRLLPSGSPTFHQQAVSAARSLNRIATLFQGTCDAVSLGQNAGADQLAPYLRVCYRMIKMAVRSVQNKRQKHSTTQTAYYR
jgi:hypothetical protein